MKKIYESRKEGARARYAKNPGKYKAAMNARRKANPEKIKLYNWRQNLKRMYNITPELYSKMFEEQGGQCAVCKKPLEFRGTSTHVDHDHTTGKVRGLLCNMCNMGLAGFQDNSVSLEEAIRYVTDRAVVS